MGTTFKVWSNTTPAMPDATPPVPANPNASYKVDNFGDKSFPTISWYWNDPAPDPGSGKKYTPETVTCALTLTYQNGMATQMVSLN